MRPGQSPGNGQGYEGMKDPSTIGDGNHQNTLPGLAAIQLSALTSTLSETPVASWEATTYSGFKAYLVEVFSFPGGQRVAGPVSITATEHQFTGLSLTAGEQYVFTVRILSDTGAGPLTYSAPFTAN